MENNSKLAPHETLELHELLSTSIIGVKKATATLNMVNDQELKNFLTSSLDGKKTNLRELQEFVKENL
ncbi:hypothetical protein U732_995 [Clostridium argentinense CDC 2741]|uniref:Spore coat protein n=1 Tax=Clostridium argentinense CDC 2741 TaxID=1418104 RepID=A0A0C1TZZ5_9CLOT|nr:hypothetical protein [Clostridium argentinense]ARC84429.1 hypothetical protein RSJ17_07750 [Clostridium argentinense]KIE44838.1 hypothetical protein U732_995 [Clostridium argentinense CDC 2741]NFF38788.1 hypothetical protein [Clostridium argentinense]NFP49013.1 hypothetical protein [Clostridium argentinense]NFP72531.1 hypothetical protein [Clostridium argentinense]